MPNQEITTTVEVNQTWNAKIDNQGNLTCDPCPHCGNDGIFNTSIKSSGQHEDNTDSPQISADCTELLYVGCNECWEDLYQKGESKELTVPKNKRSEGRNTYYDCPECFTTLCEWTDCPECGWYDEESWEIITK